MSLPSLLSFTLSPILPLIYSLSLPHSQDESSALAKSALAAYQYDLKKMSLRAVNVLLVNPGKKVRRLHLHIPLPLSPIHVCHYRSNLLLAMPCVRR